MAVSRTIPHLGTDFTANDALCSSFAAIRARLYRDDRSPAKAQRTERVPAILGICRNDLSSTHVNLTVRMGAVQDSLYSKLRTTMVLPQLLAFLLVTSSSSSNYTPGFPGGIIAWVVCYRSRRSPVGGWLMFYYWQLYGGILLTAITFMVAFQSYVPESFADAGLYHLFLLSAVPILLIFGIQVAVSTMLLSVRSWGLLKLLRWVLLAQLVACSVAVAIDVKKFPDALFFDVWDAIGPAIWSLYLLRSERVRHVFRTCDWDEAVAKFYPLSPQQPAN